MEEDFAMQRKAMKMSKVVALASFLNLTWYNHYDATYTIILKKYILVQNCIKPTLSVTKNKLFNLW